MRLLGLGAVLGLVLVSCKVNEPSPFTILLTVDPAHLTATDSMQVTVEVFNTSSRTITGANALDYGPCNHPFQIFSGSQEVAVPTLLCAQAMNPPVSIPPGSAVTLVDWWKPGASTLNGQPLAPGSYSINGKYHADNGIHTSISIGVTLQP